MINSQIVNINNNMDTFNKIVDIFKPKAEKKEPIEESKEQPGENIEIYESDVDIYLLFNPLSGSKEGKSYASMDKKHHYFTLEIDITVKLTLVNITEKSEIARAKDDIKQAVYEK